MPNLTRRSWLGITGAALLASGIPVQASNREDKPDNTWKPANPRETIQRRHLPNVALVTHEGKKVRFYDDLIKDKIVVINMMYATCEGICPAITSNLQKVQKLLGNRMGRDIFFYSITLKPERDTPEVLKEHVKMHGIQPGWLFLTGAPADIEVLRRKLGFVDPDPEVDKDTTNHIGNIRYGNEPLMLWAAMPGSIKPASLVEAIETQVDWPKPESTPATAVKGERK
ncbi:MAG: SCO family protein [Pyrinomonadaceae bacterium]